VADMMDAFRRLLDGPPPAPSEARFLLPDMLLMCGGDRAVGE
jgi:hypothetical protein